MNSGKGISISARNRLCLNLYNLVFFLIVTLTGSVIQIHYHMQRLPEAYPVMSFDKTGWVLLHKTSVVAFFAGLVVHCLVNWGVISTSTKRIFDGKLKPLTSHSYWLFLISIPVCLTAMASWFLFGGKERARFVLVETHDKLGWFLVIFGFIHLISRSGRMMSTYRKSKREKTTRRKDRTGYICFDSGKCKACWKCLEACPRDVFGKINILIHKHMKIVNRNKCTGCLKCTKSCSHGAISPIIACG